MGQFALRAGGPGDLGKGNVMFKKWKRAGVGALIVGSAGGASAAVPEAFTTAVTNMTTDGSAMALALVGVAAAVQVVLLAVSYVRKIKSAAK